METIKKIWPYVVIIVLLFLLFRSCNRGEASKDSVQSTNDFLADTLRYYDNKIGQEIAIKKAIEGDKKALEVLLSKQVDSTQQLKSIVDNFKKIQSAGNISQKIDIDTVFVPYTSISESKENLFNKSTPYYSISGKTNNDGLFIDNLTAPNILSFAIGDKKTSWFNSEYRIEAVNSNPYVKTIGLDSYTLKVPRKRLGLSLYVGYGVTSDFQMRPSAGLALTYSLFQF